VLLNEGNVWQSAIVMLRSHGMGARREARRRANALERQKRGRAMAVNRQGQMRVEHSGKKLETEKFQINS